MQYVNKLVAKHKTKRKQMIEICVLFQTKKKMWVFMEIEICHLGTAQKEAINKLGNL